MNKHILATSASYGLSDGIFNLGPIIKYGLELTGKKTPRLCYIGTAGGDNPASITSFYNACQNENVKPAHLELFPMPNVNDVRKFLLAQDMIWVGGGSVANLLSIWRLHGIDKIIKEAWQKGIVLGGISAGSICWHAGGTTDSFGVDLRPVNDGLGLLPYSNGVHYDSEERRRPLFQKLVAENIIPEGYATDDGVGLHYINDKLHKVISDSPGKFAYSIVKADKGVVEKKLTPELLS